MERLTHKARHEAGYKVNRGKSLWECVDKLGKLEDLKVQGKLPELSCAVGDTVYVISRMDIIPMEVIGVSMFLLNSEMVIQFNGFCDTEMWNMHFTGDDIGRNVFLTQREAEESLEGMVD